MKLMLSILLVAFGSVGAAGARGDEPVQLRVLSYNIHHGEGVDGILDLQRIARVIRSVEPDLVALQEVDQQVKRTRSIDQPAELARLTGMNVAFAANIQLQGGQYGNAILSRFPIIRHENHLLPNIDASEQRGVLEAEIAVPRVVQPLLLLATHLDFRSDDRERFASAEKINALVAQHPRQPAVLAGDLNDTEESRTLRRLEQMWTIGNDRPMPTVPVDRPTKQIDFILYRPQERWRVVELRVLDESVASDHRAVFAVLELLQPGTDASSPAKDEVQGRPSGR